MTAAIKIESIYIGNKISLQIKMIEGDVRLLGTGKKRLLRPNAKPRVVMEVNNVEVNNDNDNDNEQKSDESDESDGSLSESDDEQQEQPPVEKKTSPKVTRKVVRRKAAD